MPRIRAIYDPAVMQNRAARELIREKAIETYIPLEAQIFPASTNVLGTNIAFTPENIGLIKGFWVEIAAVATNTGTTASSSFIGPLGLISNVTFTDAQGITRVNLPLYALHFLNSAKQRFPFAHTAKSTALDTPVNYGSNSSTASIPNTLWLLSGTPFGSFNQVQITNGQTSNIRLVFWVPLAYSDTDYRGAIYAGTLNTQMTLQVTVNPNAFWTSQPGDQLNVLWLATQGSGTITQFQINVTQVSMDQLPVNPSTGKPILPLQDLSTVYELQQRAFVGLSGGVDFKTTLPDYRDVLSVFLAWSTMSLPVPAQFKYFGLRGPITFIKKWSASLAMAESRKIFKTDLPFTLIWFDFRSAPVSNTRYGSLSLIANPLPGVNPTAPLYQSLESFVNVGQLINAN